MQSTPEISIDLTAQELLDVTPGSPIAIADICEVDDICAVDPLLATTAPAANEPAARAEMESAADDALEIELTVDQIDLVLRGRPFR